MASARFHSRYVLTAQNLKPKIFTEVTDAIQHSGKTKLKDLLSFYHDHGSTMYVAFLDASKAFDRVNYATLSVSYLQGMCLV